MSRFRLSLIAALASASFAVHASPIVFSASGSNAVAIQGTVDAFRTALGTLNPNVVGSFGGGRREINWDGVPNAFSAPSNLPANFFNVNSPRGVTFSTPGTGFQVSANAGVAPVRFDNIEPSYSSLFATFSAQRLFTALGSTVTDVNFFVPGSTTPAFVTAFGTVFTDIDVSTSTSIQFFDLDNVSLGTFSAPAASGDGTLSFLGVRFDAGERVGRVRITSGNQILGARELGDLVVMDDFIYAEPRAVPEPATAALMLAPWALWFARRRRPPSRLTQKARCVEARVDERIEHVVAPCAVDEQVILRKALANESQPREQRGAALILRQVVGLHAMQCLDLEHVTNRLLERLVHQPLALVGGVDLVAEYAALERPAKNLREADTADHDLTFGRR